MVCSGDNINNNTELLHTTIVSSSQRDAPYQVSALQRPITSSPAKTPSMPSASPSTTLPLASPQVSSMSTLTSPAPLPQSHKRLRASDGKNNVNCNRNVLNSVIASSNMGRGRGRSSRSTGRGSRGKSNRKPSKTADDYQWKTIDDFVNTNVTVDTGRKLNVHKTFRRRPGRLLNVLCTFNLCPVSTGVPAHPYFEASRLVRFINETLPPLEVSYKMFLRNTIQQIAAETNRYYPQC